VRAGDLVPVSHACTAPTAGDFVRPPVQPAVIRVIPGPHQEIASGEVHVEEVSRIGVRVSGGRLQHPAPVRADLPSLGVLPGTVQVLPSGHWMVLGPDAGTMGGYPVAGVVASADLGAWAHVSVGDVVRLQVVAADGAQDPPIPAIVHVHGLGG
jgi:allophanate hydrolase subunit 2